MCIAIHVCTMVNYLSVCIAMGWFTVRGRTTEGLHWLLEGAILSSRSREDSSV